jgi:S1-C subfamily serine protease
MTRKSRTITGRTLAAAAALAAASLAIAGPATADDTATTDKNSDSTTSTTGTSTGTAQEQVAPLVQPSVVYETISWSGYIYDSYNKQYLRDKPFRITMQCTGFVVNPDGYVATAGHCVDPKGGRDALKSAAAEWALQNYYTNSFFLAEEDVIGDYRIDTLGDDGRVAKNHVDSTVKVSWGASVSGVDVLKQKPARVLAFQKFDEGDGALLKVDETDLNAIELADTSDVEINANVTAIGYPAIIDAYTDQDLTPTFDVGNVSSIKTVADGLLSVFQLSAELSGGMSGGPTVDAEGRVIGVNSSHFVGEPFNYAVPAERIRELMDSAGVENVVSETTQTYRDGIRAYFDGDRETAVNSLEAVLEEQSANGFAKDYLDKAKDLPAPPAEKSDTNWVAWGALAAGVVVAIVGGLAILLTIIRRMRRRTPVAAQVAAPVVPAPAQAQESQPMGQPAPQFGAQPVPTAAAPAPVPAGFAPSAPAPQPPTGGGVAVAQPTVSPTAYCTTCGEGMDAGTNFCGSCGTRNQPRG